ncbi:hypothetical protein [Microbacterium sp.]|uniref:hypothetical protein n=1 Tax=Microbacterium sp. TaxID=51671 RepID=UPI0039E3E974
MDIDFAEILLAALRVLGVGLLFGAGLPALFALGIRLRAAGAGEASDGVQVARRPVLTATGNVLFLIVIAAVVAGVLWITRHSLDHYLGISLFGV